MIQVTHRIALDPKEIIETFVHASGPGGQNVNKVSTAVQLRFNVLLSASLPEDVRGRLVRLVGRRLTRDGELVIVAQSHRTQVRNRADALERLLDLIRQAAVPPVRRRATKPTKASKTRHREAKSRRAQTKRMRSRPHDD